MEYKYYFFELILFFFLFYLPLFLCGAFAVFKVLSLKAMIIHWWQRIDVEYGLKQIQVIGHSARLILFPIGQTFDYDFPNTFFTTNTLLTTALLFALGIVLAIALYFPKARAMVSFCVFWFFITLAPTNSILPRSDLLSERNLYLPSFGILFLLAITIHRLVLANHNQLVVRKIGTYCLIIFFLADVKLLLNFMISIINSINIMRKNLKPRSFKIWRRRVKGRRSKHQKKSELQSKFENYKININEIF